MTITTGTQSEQYQAADGRFFNIIETQEAHTSWEKFGRRLLDISGLIRLQDEIMELAGIVRNSSNHEVGKAIVGHYRESLQETRDLLATGLHVDEGLLVVTSKLDNDRRLDGYASLAKDYRMDRQPRSFIIPAEKITARQVNLCENTEEQSFSPAVDLRIQTSSDPTVSRFVAPGEIAEETSPGRWYRFPLSSTVVTVYS